MVIDFVRFRNELLRDQLTGHFHGHPLQELSRWACPNNTHSLIVNINRNYTEVMKNCNVRMECGFETV
jgi:hypothetical protein